MRPNLPVYSELRNSVLETWGLAEKVASADVIMFLEKDLTRSAKLTEPKQALTLHIVKNRGGERGKLVFEFQPAFAKFAATEP
jgi:replicative DNA helicase